MSEPKKPFVQPELTFIKPGTDAHNAILAQLRRQAAAVRPVAPKDEPRK